MRKSVQNNLEGKNGNYILPFFWQHGEEEAVLRKYMQVIQDAGIGAVCVESRPHPDFCGPKWWQDMDIILEEAKKRQMKVWILDDSHFPTGFANGAMKDQPETLCRRGICYEGLLLTGNGRKQHIPVSAFLKKKNTKRNMYSVLDIIHKKKKRSYSDDILFSVTAVPVDETARQAQERMSGGKDGWIDLSHQAADNKLEWMVPDGIWKVALCKLSYRCGAHQDYINMSSPESCRVLIDTVYEPHWAHYREEFGTTIAGFFSDEPELGNGPAYSHERLGTKQDLPWSDTLEKALEKRMGKEWKEILPYLWEEDLEAGKTAEMRYIYMDVLTTCVQEAFSQQVGDWCHEHGVEYIGHVVEDLGGHARTGGALGHYFRGLWGQDMAGIDDIGGQVMPQAEDILENPPMLMKFQQRDGEFYHYELARLGTSLAALDPKKQGRTMCEIFGNYGWQEGLRLERYLADHFMVNGVNRYVPHAFSAKPFPDPDCPPHFYAHGHNPQYRHFKSLMQYMNRICELISGGTHAAPIGLLYHAESEWTGKSMADQKVLRCLLDAQLNADLIPVDAFARRAEYRTDLSEGLRINTQEYRMLVIPYSQFIGKALVKAIGELNQIAVPVVFIDALPDGMYDDKGELSGALARCKVIALDDLVRYIYEEKLGEISISPQNNRLRYLHYQKNGDLYYFVNEGTETYWGEISVPLMGTAYIYNAWENKLEYLEQKTETARTGFSLRLEPLQSCLVIFGDQPEGQLYAPLFQIEEKGKKIFFPEAWERSICRSIQYPDFTERKKVSLPDRLTQERPRFSGWVRYENQINIRNIIPTILVVTDAYEGVEVFVNGKSAGVQVTPTYRFDITELLKTGKNEIVIEVSTTLERERTYARGKGMIERVQQRKIKDPTGITGEVYLCQYQGD